MIAAAALGDVVEEHGDVERATRGDLAEQSGGERMVLLKLALVDPGEEADRPDRMLVDRIMVIHVELHLRDDASEVGNEAAEDARLVHPPEHDLRPINAGQHLHEERVGARVMPDFTVDQRSVAGGGAHR